MPSIPTSTTTVQLKRERWFVSQGNHAVEKLTTLFARSTLQSRAQPTVDETDGHLENLGSGKQEPQHSQSWPIVARDREKTTSKNQLVPNRDTMHRGMSNEEYLKAQPVSRSCRPQSLNLGMFTATADTSELTKTNMGLLPSLSVNAPAGIGLKSRKLSIDVPEYHIECLPLKSEFRSAGSLPGAKGKLLGKGATANVRLMIRKGGAKNELYAVKDFRGKEVDEKEEDYVKKVRSEYSIAKSLNHPNIVSTVQLCTSRGRWSHVMEYCDQGELFAFINKRYFTSEDTLCFWKQLICGVNYLHSHGIAHRDIKPENLLLTSTGCLKITDFGVAEVFSGEHPGGQAACGERGMNTSEMRKSAPGICGSMPYVAPEVLRKEDEYDPRPLDVWSCAIIFFTMRFYGFPWLSANPRHEKYAQFKKGWDDWLLSHPDGSIPDPSSFNTEDLPRCGPLFQALQKPALKRLLLKMLHPHPEKRISIGDAIKTSFFKHIDCCSEIPLHQPENPGALKSLKGPYVVKRRHQHIPRK